MRASGRNEGNSFMKFGMRNVRARRAAIAAGAGVTALALMANGGAAFASVETVSSVSVVGDGRNWDFANDSSSGFGIDDGELYNGRYAEDAFDTGLVLYVDGTVFYDEDDLGVLNAGKQTMNLGPSALSGLNVSRSEQAKGPYLRSLIKLNNPTGSAITTNLEWYSNLGSDSSEVANGSSSGKNLKFEKSDRWLVTHAPDDTGYGDDPALGFVFFGKNAAVHTTTIEDGPGDGAIGVDYTVKVPAGKTRYLLFYTEMWSTPAQAVKSMKKYDKEGLTSSLLSGLSKSVRGSVVNWNL